MARVMIGKQLKDTRFWHIMSELLTQWVVLKWNRVFWEVLIHLILEVLKEKLGEHLLSMV